MPRTGLVLKMTRRPNGRDVLERPAFHGAKRARACPAQGGFQNVTSAPPAPRAPSSAERGKAVGVTRSRYRSCAQYAPKLHR